MMYKSIYYCIRVNAHIIVSILLLNFKVESNSQLK